MMLQTQVQNTAQQINSVIDHLAEKLAVPASAVWTILVRQSYVFAWMSLLFATLQLGGVLLLVFALRFCYRRYTHCIETQKKEFADLLQPGTPWVFAMLGAGIAGAVFSSYVVVNLGDAIGQFANPQYYALHQVLSALR